MLAVTGGEPFDSSAHLFELIWDGLRAIAFVDASGLRLQDGFGRDITDRYPELQGAIAQVGPGSVLDGEIVALDDAGRPDFSGLLSRLSHDDGSARDQSERVTIAFEAYDILYRSGEPVMNYTLGRRKDVLRQAVRAGGPVLVTDFVPRDGIAFFEAARQHDLPGIVARERNSRYVPGKTSRAWVDLRVFQRREFVICGHTFGGPLRPARRTKRQQPSASVLLGLYDDRGLLRYTGELTAGFAGESWQRAATTLDSAGSSHCPFVDPPQFDRLIFWCRPVLVATVRFAQWTAAQRLRFPVFEGLRPDVPPESCRLP